MYGRREQSGSWQVVVLLAAMLMCWLALPAKAAGLLTPKDGSLPELEIRDHHVDVVIEDGYAITRVEQVFHNPHNRDLEAIYSFPVPEHGAVSEFTLWIDGQPISGEVLEKQEARRVYEEEKAAGREAGLTEKDSYKTIDIAVSPVRAGGDTRIRLSYMQTARVDNGIGRYLYPLEEGGVDEQKLAFWTANEAVIGSFRFNLTLKPGYPVEALRVPGRPNAQVSQNSDGSWQVRMESQGGGSVAEEEGQTPKPQQTESAAFSLERDLVVYWRHKAGLPGSVDLVTHKPDASGRGTFMLTLTPGDDLKPIQKGSDWIFVLDVSGSMQGKYATLADGVERALGRMRPADRFRIVLFNNSSRELTPGYTDASAENVRRYSEKLANYRPGGGTNLYAGLRNGLRAIDADRTSAIVLVTDGVANVGETAQKGFIKLLGQKDVRLFTFIMGNSANRPMLEALTRHSNGFAVGISNSDDIVGKILEATNKVTHQALHGVTLDIDGVKVADLTPRRIGSLYRGQQLVVLGHYWGDGEAEVTLRGKVSGEKKRYRSRFPFPAVSDAHPELERLWAYAGIEQMQQQMADFGKDADIKRAVTDLALEYSLVSDYTSMVVLREEVYAERGIERRNRERLATEAQARQQRSQQPAQSNRADSAQPMFNSPRPGYSGSGGGAASWVVLPLLGLLLWRRRAG
ncbi:MAG: VIT and vWA domain-containing protein [Pseudomonadota bacterium]